MKQAVPVRVSRHHPYPTITRLLAKIKDGFHHIPYEEEAGTLKIAPHPFARGKARLVSPPRPSPQIPPTPSPLPRPSTAHPAPAPAPPSVGTRGGPSLTWPGGSSFATWGDAIRFKSLDRFGFCGWWVAVVAGLLISAFLLRRIHIPSHSLKVYLGRYYPEGSSDFQEVVLKEVGRRGTFRLGWTWVDLGGLGWTWVDACARARMRSCSHAR
jgi:hypothetical protein